MSSAHETHDHAAHGSLKSYLIGFVLAVVLTVVPFMLAMNGYFTPATTAADVALVARLTGREDRVPVVTEPWAEWVISGSFPAGRPRWPARGGRERTGRTNTTPWRCGG